MAKTSVIVAPLTHRTERRLGSLKALVPPVKLNCSALEIPEAVLQQSSADEGSFFDERYELDGELGVGTFSVVRQAQCRTTHRLVAVKCITDANEEIRRITLSEYDLLRSIRHPAIIRADILLEFGSAMWLVMELCEDGTLEGHVEKNGAVTSDQAAEMSKQLTQGVDHLHRKRIIHQDVKPSNLLLTENASVVKLADFNSAAKVGSDRGRPILTFRGSQLYMAPEVLFGLLWNERVDIWACGLCSFYMARAKLPFMLGKRKVKEAVFAGVMPPVVWGTMSKEHRDFVTRCLTLDMRRRPSAIELVQHPLFLGMTLEQAATRQKAKRDRSLPPRLGCSTPEASVRHRRRTASLGRLPQNAS
mmetsp:Transcript_76687/g.228628  ORF Transcript_76687/g.228628 Transcript_76687/m.228628 type:complete len:361 (+) Transcript_76687:78-1160(+)